MSTGQSLVVNISPTFIIWYAYPAANVADLTTNVLNKLTLVLKQIGKFINYTSPNDMQVCYVTLMRPSWLPLFSRRRSRRWSRPWCATWHRPKLAACPSRSPAASWWQTGTVLWSVPCPSWSWRHQDKYWRSIQYQFLVLWFLQYNIQFMWSVF